MARECASKAWQSEIREWPPGLVSNKQWGSAMLLLLPALMTDLLITKGYSGATASRTSKPRSKELLDLPPEFLLQLRITDLDHGGASVRAAIG